MEDRTTLGSYGGYRATAEAPSAIGNVGIVMEAIPARGFSLDSSVFFDGIGHRV